MSWHSVQNLVQRKNDKENSRDQVLKKLLAKPKTPNLYNMKNSKQYLETVPIQTCLKLGTECIFSLIVTTSFCLWTWRQFVLKQSGASQGIPTARPLSHSGVCLGSGASSTACLSVAEVQGRYLRWKSAKLCIYLRNISEHLILPFFLSNERKQSFPE